MADVPGSDGLERSAVPLAQMCDVNHPRSWRHWRDVGNQNPVMTDAMVYPDLPGPLVSFDEVWKGFDLQLPWTCHKSPEQDADTGRDRLGHILQSTVRTPL